MTQTSQVTPAVDPNDPLGVQKAPLPTFKTRVVETRIIDDWVSAPDPASAIRLACDKARQVTADQAPYIISDVHASKVNG